jgi:hypothetical protein
MPVLIGLELAPEEGATPAPPSAPGPGASP